MLKNLLAFLLAFVASIHLAFAAVNANTATADELQTVAGIGPAISARIVDERKAGGPFKSIEDLQSRVKGIGEENVKKMVAAGLTVSGRTSTAAPAAKADKKDEKKDAKADKKDDKKDAKADKKDEKKDAKADKKDDKKDAKKDDAKK
jgi:competence protein ComEA